MTAAYFVHSTDGDHSTCPICHPTFTRIYRHDFNVPPNEGGFLEVFLPEFDAMPPKQGDVVIVRDYDDTGPEVRGRVRCLIAIVEEIES